MDIIVIVLIAFVVIIFIAIKYRQQVKRILFRTPVFGAGIETHTPTKGTSGPKLHVVEGPSSTGGPNGFSFSFVIKNIGEQSALDIRWGYQADNLEFHDGGGPIPELSTRDTHRIPLFEYGSSKLFYEELSNPRIVLLYKDPAGNSKSDEVPIGQQRRDDGKYEVIPRV